MTSTEVLSMYENIAGLTNQMAAAARMGDWDGLSKLESQCAAEARAVSTGVPAASGAPRLRKIDLLKQILANDREIRDVTDPWMNTVPGMSRQ
ncbi:flagellar protein FliT [Duganella sp. CT11-25]|jgi:flagellar protein FliT|uniref:flagellar protein FliT n=1 Tax=unclassified Duganella TaxID=2636909 RepID=UPI0039AFA0B2